MTGSWLISGAMKIVKVLSDEQVKKINNRFGVADLPRLRITHAFITEKTKKEAELYFQSVGVSHQINTAKLNEIRKDKFYDIGILEIQETEAEWKFMVESISNLLKRNALLWILGKLSASDIKILHRIGFIPYIFDKNAIISKIKDISRKICFFFWKMGLYPYPYLTLKPAMKNVPNLNVFLRGWQAYTPFLY